MRHRALYPFPASFCVWLLAALIALPALAEKAGAGAASEQATTPSTLELTPLSSSYTASLDKGVSIRGEATRRLRPLADGKWRYEFRVDSFIADIRESVEFRWLDNRVVPLTYRYSLSGFMISDRERAIDYDWQAMRVSGHFRDKAFERDLQQNELDPLGYQFQLMQDIRAGKTQMVYDITDDDGVDRDEFAVLQREPLDSALGQVEAIKAEKVRQGDSKRETLMWFAPERAYLLMKLVQVESDGTRYEINIRDADTG